MSKPYEAGIFGVLCVVAATLGFASQGIVVKFLFHEKVAILTILLLRKAIFLPIYWLCCRKIIIAQNSELPFRQKALSFFAGMAGYYLAPLASLHALQWIEAGLERIILYCFPGIVILLQSLVHKKCPAWKHIFLFFIILIGIYFAIGGAHVHHITTADIHGALWTLLAAFSFAVYVVCNQGMVKHMATATFIFYALLGAFCAVTLHFLLTQPFSALDISLKAWGYIALFALLCTFVPVFFFSEGVKRIGSERASLVSMLTPFLTIIFAYLFLKETLTWPQIAGGVVIVIGVIALETRNLNIFLLRGAKK